MKTDKIVLIGLMLVAIYTVVWDLLKLFGVVAITDYHARTANILFSLSATIILGALIKHKYWIVAFLFALLNRVAHIILGILFKSMHDMDNMPIVAIAVIAILSAFMSAFYLYKLSTTQDFRFKNYFRFR